MNNVFLTVKDVPEGYFSLHPVLLPSTLYFIFQKLWRNMLSKYSILHIRHTNKYFTLGIKLKLKWIEVIEGD